jgi:hypothetical protein
LEKRDPTLPKYKTQYDSLILYNNDEEKNIIDNMLKIEAKKHNRSLNIRVEKFN